MVMLVKLILMMVLMLIMLMMWMFVDVDNVDDLYFHVDYSYDVAGAD